MCAATVVFRRRFSGLLYHCVTGAEVRYAVPHKIDNTCLRFRFIQQLDHHYSVILNVLNYGRGTVREKPGVLISTGNQSCPPRVFSCIKMECRNKHGARNVCIIKTASTMFAYVSTRDAIIVTRTQNSYLVVSLLCTWRQDPNKAQNGMEEKDPLFSPNPFKNVRSFPDGSFLFLW